MITENETSYDWPFSVLEIHLCKINNCYGYKQEIQNYMQEEDIWDLLHVVWQEGKKCLLFLFSYSVAHRKGNQTEECHFSQHLYKFR